MFPKVRVKAEPRAEETVEKMAARVPAKLRGQTLALLRAMQAMQGKATPTEMGVRLLALQLQETKYLFLWWD